MKTPTPTRAIVRFGFAASALGMAILWPNEANAQVADTPPHRVEFTVSPALPKCNDYDAFYGILLNWVRVRSIDPTAQRKLVVDIKRLPNGTKRVDLSVLNPEGVEVGTESHAYLATEECFKVLYWTAFDAAKLLRSTIPPVEEEPPMSVDKLVQESEEPAPGRDKPPPVTVRVVTKPAEHTQCEVGEQKETRPSTQWLVGIGATVGLTRMILPGLRLGLAKSAGLLVFEFDARVSPPIVAAEWNMGGGQQASGRGYGYLGTVGLCLPGGRLLGCLFAAGGVSGYRFDQPYLFDERFSKAPYGGVFDVGLRMGARFGVSNKLALRLDLEATVPIYRADRFVWEARANDQKPTSALSGFVSFVPLF